LPLLAGACAATSPESDEIDDSSGETRDDGVATAKKPFPQASRAFGIRPSNHGQSSLDEAVRDYYDSWKATHVEASNGTTPGGGYFVRMQGVGPGGNESKTTSEAHGYGMIIFALMAGHDPKAKKYFDGMYNMYDKHRSTESSANMSWIITNSEKKSGDSASATDGDMDIAYALILADRQWGSGGTINYLSAAKNIITKGIKQGDMGPNGRTGLGDWDTDPWNTRASDWMPGHMRAFRSVTGDDDWRDAVGTVYSLVEMIQQNHSPKTGLMPDFVVGSTPKPAPNNYLDEGTVDFSWNACRFPLRIAVDHGHHGKDRAKKALTPVMSWITAKTGNSPSKIKAGYRLNGDAQESYSDLAFTGPMVAAATIDAQYQSFLNKGWDLIRSQEQDYYGDTLALLSMLHISGNWWKP
jgi:endo-1,4-beta-D-glucanase Y